MKAFESHEADYSKIYRSLNDGEVIQTDLANRCNWSDKWLLQSFDKMSSIYSIDLSD